MAGLVPAISIGLARRCHPYRDGRDEPGHDKWRVRRAPARHPIAASQPRRRHAGRHAAHGHRHQPGGAVPAGGGAVVEPDQRQPGRSRSHLHGAEFRRGVLGSAHLHGPGRHHRLLLGLARGGARLRHSGGLARRAHRFSGQDAPVHPHGGGSAHSGLCGRDGLAVSAASAHRLAQSIADEQLSSRRSAARHQHGRRHGLGAGIEPGAARLHHDGGGVPLHGSDARGGRPDARRRRHHGPAPDHRAARLARHHGGRHLHLHDRVRGLRRPGHHRLGQPHLHLHHLSVSAAQSAGFACPAMGSALRSAPSPWRSRR